MREINDIIARCRDICENPRAQLDTAVSAGKKAVGIVPYFCPEELVYAAGMLPFGLWGAQLQISEAKRYFPAFICSILQTTLEMGIRGELNALSAVMVPICCDSLKSMGTNWEHGVSNIPVINVAYAQNRKIAAGDEFTASQYRKIRAQLEELAGRGISDADIAAAVAVYNENRAARSAFSDAAGRHPDLVGARARSYALKCGYFTDRREHTALLRELTAALEAAPACEKSFVPVVTTGIIADCPELLEILENNSLAIVGDQVAHESVGCCPTPVTDEPVLGLAQRIGKIEGSSVLFDPGKQRGRELVRLVREKGARGVIWVMTKFCDPEEFDLVPVKRMLDEAGIPLVTVELDQQMTSFGQAASAIEAFAEMIG